MLKALKKSFTVFAFVVGIHLFFFAIIFITDSGSAKFSKAPMLSNKELNDYLEREIINEFEVDTVEVKRQ